MRFDIINILESNDLKMTGVVDVMNGKMIILSIILM